MLTVFGIIISAIGLCFFLRMLDAYIDYNDEPPPFRYVALAAFFSFGISVSVFALIALVYNAA